MYSQFPLLIFLEDFISYTATGTGFNGLDIAISEKGVFIYFSKQLLINEKIKQVMQLLRDLQIEAPNGYDEDGIPYVSDEEQAEIETKLASLTPEDREIVRTEHFQI